MSTYFRREDQRYGCTWDSIESGEGQPPELPRPEKRHGAMSVLAYLWEVFQTRAKRPN